MDNIDYFYKLQNKSSLAENIKNKITTALESDWYNFLDMSILPLNVSEFKNDIGLLSIIDKFNCYEKLGVYRYSPNFCYQWHIDSIRNAAINMQIDGADSFCAFGELAQARKFDKVERLVYEPSTYYLINTSKQHTVFNFDNPRFILSIGIPKPITYNEVKQFIIDNNL